MMRLRIKQFNRQKIKNVNKINKKEDEKLSNEELFDKMRNTYKKEAEERLYWANKAMSEYFKEEKQIMRHRSLEKSSH